MYFLMQTSEAYYKQATFFTMRDLVHDLAISLLASLAIKFWIRANKEKLGEAAANMHCSEIVAGHWSYA